MKLEEITSLFKGLETKYKVSEWEIEGIPLWPFIRIENNYLLSLSLLSQKVQPNFNRENYYKKILFNLFIWLKALLKYNSKSKITSSDIVFLNEGVSFTKINGKWYNKFSDPFILNFKSKGYSTFSLDLSHRYLEPKYSISRNIQFRIDFTIIKATLFNKIKRPKFNDERWVDFDLFVSDKTVKEYFKQTPSKDKLRKKVYKILRLKKYFVSLLSKCKPKEAYVVCYYGDYQMAFILACKELRIKTFDIQHGVQGEHHLAYCNWTNVPGNGFLCFPDGFLLWSDKESKAMESTNSANFIQWHKPIVSGNAFANHWKNNDDQDVIYYDNKIRELSGNTEKSNVLLSLSPFTDNMMDEVWKVVKETQNDFNWWIRLHPAMLGEKSNVTQLLSKKGINNYNLQEATEYPLYALLRNMTVQVTVQSSTVIEANDFGVPTIITSEYGWSLFRSQIDNSLNVCGIESAAILELINSFSAKSKKNKNE
jgi:hypothetical protein